MEERERAEQFKNGMDERTGRVADICVDAIEKIINGENMIISQEAKDKMKEEVSHALQSYFLIETISMMAMPRN